MDDAALIADLRQREPGLLAALSALSGTGQREACNTVLQFVLAAERRRIRDRTLAREMLTVRTGIAGGQPIYSYTHVPDVMFRVACAIGDVPFPNTALIPWLDEMRRKALERPTGMYVDRMVDLP